MIDPTIAQTGVNTGNCETKTVIIDTNLTDKEFYFVNFDQTDENVVNLAADQTLPPYILIEGGNGATNKVPGTIVLSGRAKLKIAEAVTPGKFLVPTAAGLGEVADAAGERYGAIALTGGVANDIIEVEVQRGEVEASDA